MSDIQRWDAHDRMSRNDARGYWVKYADHVAALLTQDQQHMEQQAAAVAAAEQRIRTHEGCADAEREEGYDAGYTDALAAAREVVAALMPGHYSLLDPSTGYNVSIVTDAVRKDEALAAIDALAGDDK